jgi:hypothetical protein
MRKEKIIFKVFKIYINFYKLKKLIYNKYENIYSILIHISIFITFIIRLLLNIKIRLTTLKLSSIIIIIKTLIFFSILTYSLSFRLIKKITTCLKLISI